MFLVGSKQVDMYLNNSSWNVLLVPCVVHMFRMTTIAEIILTELSLYTGMEAWAYSCSS
jgi:hypothetical protein